MFKMSWVLTLTLFSDLTYVDEDKWKVENNSKWKSSSEIFASLHVPWQQLQAIGFPSDWPKGEG